MISLYCPGRCYSRSAAADREPEARTRAAIAYRAYQRAEPGQNPSLGALPTRVPDRLTCLLLSWLIQRNLRPLQTWRAGETNGIWQEGLVPQTKRSS
jgi:hypothetical protein